MLQPRLNIKVTQRQALTPSLVQMVSVLALNKLELKEMINGELVENPVLEELEESAETMDQRAAREGDRERSAAGRAPPRSSSASAEGTVLTRVTGAVAGSSARARASRTKTTVPPAASGAKISKIDRSKPIEVAASTPARRSRGKAASAQLTKSAAARCGMATPFGAPVEPEV